MSTSAYYDWKNTEATGPSEQEIEDGCVLAEMRAIHEDSRCHPREPSDDKGAASAGLLRQSQAH